MDYKYIEQLLDRYWNCETSVEEEQILRSFFHQDDVPANLLKYKPLFAYQENQKSVGLSDDFDEKILGMIEKPVVKAKRITFYNRFMPLFKAAAIITILFSVGVVMQRSMDKKSNGVVYVYDQYKSNKTESKVAYESNLPLDSVSKVIKNSDSIALDN